MSLCTGDLPEPQDPSTVLTSLAVISSFSSDFTNKQMRQKLLIVKKYHWLPVWLFVSPYSSLLRWTDTAPWGQRGSHRAPARPSADVC